MAAARSTARGSRRARLLTNAGRKANVARAKELLATTQPPAQKGFASLKDLAEDGSASSSRQQRQPARKPHLFTAVNGSPLFALAGLWEKWRNCETKGEILSCTLITTAANEWMTPYHDRMPALVAQDAIDRWLRGEMSAEELHVVPNDVLRKRRVSARINKSGVFDDDPTVLEADELDLL